MDTKDAAETLAANALKLLRQGNHSRAAVVIRRALLIEPNRAELFNILGMIEASQGDYETAIRTFRRALKLDSDCANARDNLARSLVDHANFVNPADDNQLAEALLLYQEGTRIHPGDARFRIGEATTLHQINENLPESARDWSSSQRAFKTAAELAPECAEVLYGLGVSELYLKNYLAAEQALRIAVHVDPTQEHYYVALARAQKKMWKWLALFKTAKQYSKLKVRMRNDVDKRGTKG